MSTHEEVLEKLDKAEEKPSSTVFVEEYIFQAFVDWLIKNK